MIPMFKAKEEEAKHEYDKIISVKEQLNKFSEGLGFPKKKVFLPLATTSFMVNKPIVRKTSPKFVKKVSIPKEEPKSEIVKVHKPKVKSESKIKPLWITKSRSTTVSTVVSNHEA